MTGEATPQPGLATELARWVSDQPTGLDDVDVLYWTKQGLLDYLGVTLAAGAAAESQVVTEFLTADDQWRDRGAPVIGTGRRATPGGAAFANATLGHLHDFDDLSDTMVGHPSVVTIPALLSAAVASRPTGRQFLDAYLIAFELASKLGLGFNYTQTEKGWHTTATLGIFGAAAGVGRLDGDDSEVIRRAMGIAASFASGLKVNFGTVTKPLHVGRAAQSGLAAARLAQLGADSRADAFEYHQGYAMVFNGPGNFDLEGIVDRFGRPWEMVDPGIAFKLYPSCGATHSAIDAAIELHATTDPDDIESVDVYLHPRRLKTVNRPQVRSRFDRKFSVQYTTALGLARGRVQITDFLDDDEIPPDVDTVLGRLTAHAMPEDRWGPDHFPAEVAVTLRSGERREVRVQKAKGRGPKFAATEEERIAKFRSCAGIALSDAKVEWVISTVMDLEHADSELLRDLIDELAGPTQSPTG